MALVDQTQHNIVVHPEVTGSISLMLQNVTVEEVLDVVSEVYGYNYRKSAAGYIVFPATLQSRIFQINYLNLQRSGVSRTRVSSGQVSESRQAAVATRATWATAWLVLKLAMIRGINRRSAALASRRTTWPISGRSSRKRSSK